MARDEDPYLYENSDVLRNKEDIREAGELERFERLMTAQRQSEGLPDVPLTADGYRDLHHHLLQDVYQWAGEIRTVDMSKNSDPFCRAAFIERELDKRFAAIQSENGLQGLSAEKFAERAGEHISELNAIHPFREGNGRAMRAFLEVLGARAGHEIDVRNIDPDRWNDASRVSFRTGDSTSMRDVIAGAIVSPSLERAPLVVLDAATGVAEKLIDFVSNLLTASTPPKLTHSQAAAFEQMQANRRASAAIDNIAESMERGENLRPSDIQALTPTHLENIRRHGDDYVRELVEAAERSRDRYLDPGRDRER